MLRERIMDQQVENPFGNPDELVQAIRDEIDQARRSLDEVNLMLEQSQTELSKLVQRNATITERLRQIHDHFDTVPRDDIRMTYNAALEAQQRLLVMRGQLEKLQNDQSHLQKFISLAEKSEQLFGNQDARAEGGDGGAKTALEMLIDAQEMERHKLSRQIHDGPAQALSNFIVQVEIALRLFDVDPAKAKEELNNLKAAATGTFKKVRDFIFALRPMMLDDLGIVPTLQRYVGAYKEQTGVEVMFTVAGRERRFDSYTEVMVFRTVQELLNIAVANNADSGVKLALKVMMVLDDHLIQVSVLDNGKSFTPETLPEAIASGFTRIRELVGMMGGVMEVEATSGQGNKVSFQLPVSSE